MPVLTSRRWIAGGVLIACGAAALVLWPHRASVAQNQKADADKAAPPVPVRVAQAVVQDQPLAISAVGQVQAARQAVVRARIEGLLTEVNFAEGQPVRQGQVLARLDDRSLQAQVAQAEAELKRLQAQLQLAELDLKRYQGLAEQSAVSTQQRDQQQALVDQLRAQVQSQQASLSQVRTQLSYTAITAPFSGRAGLRLVDVGNIVRPSDAQGIVTLAQTEPLNVVFSVPQARLADVRNALAQPKGAVISVSEREGGASLAQGRLRSADNAVDAGSGTLKLKAELTPAGDRLWPGQFVTVSLNTGALPGALTVPAKAVQRGLKGPFVWRVVQGEAQMVSVQPAWQSDVVVVVKPAADGLKAGDQVVVDGQSRLKPKARVKLVGEGGTAAAEATSAGKP